MPSAIAQTIFISLALLASAVHAESWVVEERESLASPAGLEVAKIAVRSGRTRATLHAVTFSGATHSFAIMDDPQNAFDLAAAAQKRGAVAAVNGGYFHPDRTPLGLRVRMGKQIHPLQKAPLLSGLMSVTSGKIALLRVGEFRRTAGLTEAVQCGPFLVDKGTPVTGLNAIRPAARTAIIEGAGKRYGLLTTSSLTLAEAGAVLATPELISNMKISRALNLDGGSSTGLWIAGDPPLYLRELRDVRDFVGIVPKSM